MIQIKLIESPDLQCIEEKINKFLKELDEKHWIHQSCKTTKYQDFSRNYFLTEIMYIIPKKIEEWKNIKEQIDKIVEKLEKEKEAEPKP